MTWKPTEGQQRANHLLNELEIETIAAGAGLASALMKARLFDAVAKAIDEALAHGAERVIGIAPVAGNGHDPYEDALFIDRLSGLEGYTAPPATADPVGFEYVASFPGSGLPDAAAAITEHDDGSIEVKLSAPAPKKRGRPKGSKGKAPKAKKAKGRKSLYPTLEEAPVARNETNERALAEALANGSVEPPPAEAPPA